MPLILVTVLAKPEPVDTCSVYDPASDVTLQPSVGVIEVFCVPVPGELSTTAAGTFGIVVKFQTDDQRPVPAAFVAATRQ
jgi:hypothetical protein